MYDTSALSDLVTGISPNGTATVTYSFFKNNDCTGTAFSTENKTVTAGGLVPASSVTGSLAKGDYAFQATYNGNANYTSATSECEPFSVNKATPTIHTTLKNAADDATIPNNTALALGTSVYDTSALSDLVTGHSAPTARPR